MPHPPNTQRLLLALAIAAACALPGCQRASETIVEKAIEQASGDKVDIKQDGDTVSIKTEQGEMKVATAQDGGSVALPKYALPGMAWQGYFHDTENNVFGLHQPDPEAR